MTDGNSGYYDIEFDLEKILMEGGMIDDLFYLKDIKQRKLFLTTDVEQLTVNDIVKHILQFNKEDKDIPIEERQPILLYISSNGGESDAGFSLIDVILNSKTPVYTINLGYEYSMAFLIGLAGTKRFATNHAKFLMHDGSSFVFNSGAKLRDQMDFEREVQEKVKQYVLSRSNISSREYDKKFRVEWYMFADQAKENGFVDYIIGVDCDVDCVV